MIAPSSTTVPAARSEPSPTTAPLRTVACIPTSTPSSMVQPWRTALWPTDTSVPMVSGKPWSTWQETLSCRLLRSPTTMSSASARSTALYQTLAWAARRTRPARTAPAATKADGSTTGDEPSVRVTSFIAVSLARVTARMPGVPSGAHDDEPVAHDPLAVVGQRIPDLVQDAQAAAASGASSGCSHRAGRVVDARRRSTSRCARRQHRTHRRGRRIPEPDEAVDRRRELGGVAHVEVSGAARCRR